MTVATYDLDAAIAAVRAAGYRVTKSSTERRKPVKLGGKRHADCIDHILVAGYRQKVCILPGIDASFAVEMAGIDVRAWQLRQDRRDHDAWHAEHVAAVERGDKVYDGNGLVRSVGNPSCWDCVRTFGTGTYTRDVNDERNNGGFAPSTPLVPCKEPSTHREWYHVCTSSKNTEPGSYYYR